MQNKAKALRQQAKKDRSSAKRDFLKRIKQKGPMQLDDRDIDQLKRMSIQQRMSLFTPVHKIDHPVEKKLKQPLSIAIFWQQLPLFARQGATACALFLATAAAWPLGMEGRSLYLASHPITADVGHWPMCQRLSVDTDSCRYRVQKQLSWHRAAQHLNQPLRDLANTNRHLKCCSADLRAGNTLIVWRGIRPLKEAR